MNTDNIVEEKSQRLCVTCGEPIVLENGDDGYCLQPAPNGADIVVVDEQQIARWEEDGQQREAPYHDGWVRVPFEPFAECRRCRSRIDKVAAVYVALGLWWRYKTRSWQEVTGNGLANPAWIDFWAEVEKQFGRIARPDDEWNEVEVRSQRDAWDRFRARMQSLGFDWEQVLRMPLSRAVELLRSHPSEAPVYAVESLNRLRHLGDQLSVLQELATTLPPMASAAANSSREPALSTIAGANSANNSKLFPRGPLNNPRVEALVARLDAEKCKPAKERRSDNSVARDFTRETVAPFPKARSLLSQIRRLKRDGWINL